MGKEIIAKGSEAVIYKVKDVVIKERIRKKYREKKLDEKLRKERTKREAKIMRKALKLSLPVPEVKKQGKYKIYMSFIEGKKPEITKKLAMFMGKCLALLHSNDIIHMDLTPANIIEGKGYTLIDFGLSFISTRVEDRGDDLFVSLKSLPKRQRKELLRVYRANYSKAEEVIKRVEKIKKRARYMKE